MLNYKELVPRELLEEVTRSLATHFKKLPIEMNFFDAISFLQLLQSPSVEPEFRTLLFSKLKRTVERIVNTDPEEWTKFAIKPLWLVPSPKAPFVDVLKEAIHRNLEFEIENQNADGSWSPTWAWGSSRNAEWETAETEWKGILTLAMLRSLRAFNRIEACPPTSETYPYKYHID